MEKRGEAEMMEALWKISELRNKKRVLKKNVKRSGEGRKLVKTDEEKEGGTGSENS